MLDFRKTFLSLLNSGTYGVEVEFPSLNLIPSSCNSDKELGFIKLLHEESKIPFLSHVSRSDVHLNFDIWTPYGCWNRHGPYPLELSLAESTPFNQPEFISYIKFLLNILLNPNEGPIFPFASVGYYDCGDTAKQTLGYHENFSHPALDANKLSPEQLLTLGIGLITAIVFCPIVPQLYGDKTERKVVLVSSPKAGIVKAFCSDQTGNVNIVRKIEPNYHELGVPDTAESSNPESSRVGSLHISIYSPDISPVSHMLRLVTICASVVLALHEVTNFRDQFLRVEQYANFSHHSFSNALWCDRPPEGPDVLVRYFNDLAFSFPWYLLSGERAPAVDIALTVIEKIAEILPEDEPLSDLYKLCARALKNRDPNYLFLIDSAHTMYSYINVDDYDSSKLTVRQSKNNRKFVEVSQEYYLRVFTEYLNKTFYPFHLWLDSYVDEVKSEIHTQAYKVFCYWIERLFPRLLLPDGYISVARINPIEPVLQVLNRRGLRRAFFIIENDTTVSDIRVSWDEGVLGGQKIKFI